MLVRQFRETALIIATAGWARLCQPDPTRIYLGVWTTGNNNNGTVSTNPNTPNQSGAVFAGTNSTRGNFELSRSVQPYMVTQAWYGYSAGMSMGASYCVFEEFELSVPDAQLADGVLAGSDSGGLPQGEINGPDPIHNLIVSLLAAQRQLCGGR